MTITTAMSLETCWNLSLIDRKYLNNNLITIRTYCRKKIRKRNERNGLKPLIELNTISYSKKCYSHCKLWFRNLLFFIKRCMQRLLHKSSGGFLLWTCRMSNASLNSREKNLNQFNAKFSSREAKGTIVWVFCCCCFLKWRYYKYQYGSMWTAAAQKELAWGTAAQ